MMPSVHLKKKAQSWLTTCRFDLQTPSHTSNEMQGCHLLISSLILTFPAYILPRSSYETYNRALPTPDTSDGLRLFDWQGAGGIICGQCERAGAAGRN